MLLLLTPNRIRKKLTLDPEDDERHDHSQEEKTGCTLKHRTSSGPSPFLWSVTDYRCYERNEQSTSGTELFQILPWKTTFRGNKITHNQTMQKATHKLRFEHKNEGSENKIHACCSRLFVHTCVLMPCSSMYIWWRALKPGVLIHSQALCTDIDVHHIVLIKVNPLGDARLIVHVLWHYFSSWLPSINKLLLFSMYVYVLESLFFNLDKIAVSPLRETGRLHWWWHSKRGRAEKEEVKNNLHLGNWLLLWKSPDHVWPLPFDLWLKNRGKDQGSLTIVH